jgi:hypothetical protein
VYKNQQSRQTGSRNLTGPKTLPTIWYTYMMLVTKYQIFAINSNWEKCDGNFCHIFLSNCWWQSSDIWSQASYRYPISWEAFLDPLDSYFLFVAEKNEHICSMAIKINKVGKQEVGIRWVQKRFPRYGVPIWSLWPNIRFLPSLNIYAHFSSHFSQQLLMTEIWYLVTSFI